MEAQHRISNYHNCGQIQLHWLTMAAPTYASTVAATTTPKTSAVPKLAHYEELYRPQPKSMTLVAALRLLDSPLLFSELPEQPVYLMPREYLQNWLSWALLQPTSPNEEHRVKKALQLAAKSQGVTFASTIHEPGPVDASILSVEGNSLVLKSNIVIGSPNVVNNLKNGGTSNIYCCAVPERFYEVCYLVITTLYVEIESHNPFVEVCPLTIFPFSQASPICSRYFVRRWPFCCFSSGTWQ